MKKLIYIIQLYSILSSCQSQITLISIFFESNFGHLGQLNKEFFILPNIMTKAILNCLIGKIKLEISLVFHRTYLIINSGNYGINIFFPGIYKKY